jgi:hypothetical protein
MIVAATISDALQHRQPERLANSTAFSLTRFALGGFPYGEPAEHLTTEQAAPLALLRTHGWHVSRA